MPFGDQPELNSNFRDRFNRSGDLKNHHNVKIDQDHSEAKNLGSSSGAKGRSQSSKTSGSSSRGRGKAKQNQNQKSNLRGQPSAPCKPHIVQLGETKSHKRKAVTWDDQESRSAKKKKSGSSPRRKAPPVPPKISLEEYLSDKLAKVPEELSNNQFANLAKINLARVYRTPDLTDFALYHNKYNHIMNKETLKGLAPC